MPERERILPSDQSVLTSLRSRLARPVVALLPRWFRSNSAAGNSGGKSMRAATAYSRFGRELSRCFPPPSAWNSGKLMVLHLTWNQESRTATRSFPVPSREGRKRALTSPKPC